MNNKISSVLAVLLLWYLPSCGTGDNGSPCVNWNGCVNWNIDTCECQDPPVCTLLPTECPSGIVDFENCECIPVDSPPPPGPDPTNYIHIDRVPGIIDGTAVQVGLLHGLTWGGWRDPLRVAVECASDVRYIGFASPDELTAFGIFGRELTREGEDFMIPQMRTENRRCNKASPKFDPRFLKANGDCARSEMRKSRLQEYHGTDENPRLDAHMQRVSEATRLAGRCRAKLLDRGYAYDSTWGWCQKMTLAGFSQADCPQ